MAKRTKESAVKQPELQVTPVVPVVEAPVVTPTEIAPDSVSDVQPTDLIDEIKQEAKKVVEPSADVTQLMESVLSLQTVENARKIEIYEKMKELQFGDAYTLLVHMLTLDNVKKHIILQELHKMHEQSKTK